MKLIFKYLTLMLIITLLLCGVAYSEENIKVNTKELNILRAIGVIDEKMPGFYTGDIFTRAQFASITAGLIGIKNNNTTAERYFIDVKSDYWCANQIYALKEAGIIQGVNSYQFLPDEGIIVSHAAKILVSVLGYDLLAVGKYGGTLEAYMIVANELQLLPSKNLGLNNILTSDDAINMIYRATKADIMEQTGFGNEPSYNIIKKNTLLVKYHNIYYLSNIMTDNGITALNGSSCVTPVQIKIGETILYKNEISTINFIGLYVECYYKNEDNASENYLLYIVEHKNRNEIIVLNSEELETDESSFSVTNIVYNRNDRILKISIDPLADLIYNGKAYPAFSLETLKIKSGSMKLVNNNSGNGSYNIIIINEYKNIFVSSIDTTSETIYGKYGNKVTLKDYEYVHIFDGNKNEITLSSIRTEFVVSYLESKDKSTINLYAVNNSVNESVNELREGDNPLENIYCLGEKSYKTAYSFLEAVNSNKWGIKLPKIGNGYKFYLDIEGKIAAIAEDTGAGVQYAYLLDIGTSKKLEYSNTVLVRLFMQNGEIFNAYTSNKVSVNGSVKTDCKELFQLSEIYENGKTKRQVIKVKLNSVGDITEFYYAIDNTSHEYGYNPDRFSMDYNSTGSLYRGNNQRCFDGTYSVTDASIIFMVPESEDYNVEDIMAVKSTQLVDGKTYDVTVYDADPTLSATVAVIRGSSSERYEPAIFLVDKISTIVNNDGEQVRKISGVYSGNYVSMSEWETGSLPENLKAGDVGRVAFYSGQLSSFEILASLNDKPQPFIKTIEGEFIGGTFSVTWAPLYAKSTNTISTLIPAPGSPLQITAHSLNGSVARVSVYNPLNKKAKVGTHADLTTSSVIDSTCELLINDNSTYVFIYRRYDYVHDVVVVKY